MEKGDSGITWQIYSDSIDSRSGAIFPNYSFKQWILYFFPKIVHIAFGLIVNRSVSSTTNSTLRSITCRYSEKHDCTCIARVVETSNSIDNKGIATLGFLRVVFASIRSKVRLNGDWKSTKLERSQNFQQRTDTDDVYINHVDLVKMLVLPRLLFAQGLSEDATEKKWATKSVGKLENGCGTTPIFPYH